LAYFDGDWRLCGFDAVKDYPFAYVVNMNPDFVPQTKAICGDGKTIADCEGFLFQGTVCVKECTMYPGMYIDYVPVNFVRNNPLLPPTYTTWPIGRYCVPNLDDMGG